ncbi:MAG: winged helix-turn-helix domain-containing protein [Acidobacteria bacterium]|nr:winged helix-turn-helix domain-containing protein [Acidobacteriota bacterium]
MASGLSTGRVRHRVVQFGPYEFNADSQELRKHGVKLKLQGKPLHLLAALVENPGDVVSRGELQKRLWPADTFVDFENGLNTAMKRLRGALSDSADNPVYVETLSRNGYRFIAPVQRAEAVTSEAPELRTNTRRIWLAFLAGGGAMAAAWTAVWILRSPEPAPSFRQLTFRRGPVFGARFAPDGQSVIFAAQFDGSQRQVYLNNGVSPESRPIGLAGFSVLSVSRQGELALNQHDGTNPISGGALLRVPIHGGVPVPVEQSVMSADWDPEGRQLAIVKMSGGQSILEYPAGRRLFATAGWISAVRFHRSGGRIAFIDHPARHDDAGTVRVATIDGETRAIGGSWPSTGGLAWHPSGELWLSAARELAPRSLWAINMSSGKVRSVGAFPGVVSLRDISADGRVLLTREIRRLESTADFGGGETDISWHDWTRAVDVRSGGQVLFDESGEAVGARSVTFLRSQSGTGRLADGHIALAISPDGRSALTLLHEDRGLFRITRLGGGAPQEFRAGGLQVQWAKFFPDGTHLLALAAAAGQPLRLYRLAIDGGAEPEAISAPGMVRHAAVREDGEGVLYLASDGRLTIWERGATRLVPSVEPLAPIHWQKAGRRAYVQHLKNTVGSAKVSLIDLDTGRLTFWKELGPLDKVGVDQLTRVLISPDEKAYVFTARRVQSELFSVRGLR